MGEGGAVCAREVLRFARNSREWYNNQRNDIDVSPLDGGVWMPFVLRRPSDHEVEECHAVSKGNEHHFTPAPTVCQYGYALPASTSATTPAAFVAVAPIRGEKPASAQRVISLSKAKGE